MNKVIIRMVTSPRKCDTFALGWNMNQADKIREFVVIHCIQPARGKGLSRTPIVIVRSRDFADFLDVHARVLAV